MHRTFLGSLLLGAVLLAADVAASNATATDPPAVTVGLVELPPYSYYGEAGAPTGILLPLMELVVERAGYRAEFRIMPVARLVQGIQDGSLDIWPGLDNRPDLGGHTLVGASTLGHVNINLYYRQDTPEPRWPDDLRGQDLILISGLAYWPPLMATIQDPANGIRVHRTVNHAGAIGMLIRKRGNYVLNYETPMREALTQRPDLQLASKPLTRAPLKMVVSKRASIGGQQLMEQLEGAYQALRAEHAVQELPES